MSFLSTLLKLAGLAIFFMLAIMLIAFFGFYFLVMIGCFLVIFSTAWIIGLPITIKQNGKKIGYVRWIKFYRRP